MVRRRWMLSVGFLVSNGLAGVATSPFFQRQPASLARHLHAQLLEHAGQPAIGRWLAKIRDRFAALEGKDRGLLDRKSVV